MAWLWQPALRPVLCVCAYGTSKLGCTLLPPHVCHPRVTESVCTRPTSLRPSCFPVYKLLFDVDVAEVEQQVADYMRQEVRCSQTRVTHWV